MRRFALLVLLVACKGEDDKSNKRVELQGSASAAPIGSDSTLPKIEQITPKLDLKTPPKDAVKTSSGLIYKKIVENPSGTAPQRNDTVLINYSGWRQSTGETFFTNRAQGQPIPLNLATTAAGFTEAMQLVKTGETVMIWIPPDIGFKGPPNSPPETLVYEVEITDVVPAPLLPPDYNAPPANAKVTKSGAKYVVVKPGGKERARSFDTLTFDYTAWDKEGRMFDSTEMRKRPAVFPAYRQSAVMEEILTTVAKGERIRFWVESEKMLVANLASGLPAGQLCYELELQAIEKAPGVPSPVPPDVGAPPRDAKKTERGVFYKVLKTGKGGPKPGPSDIVKVHYTGWTIDGRMFDSSHVKGTPAKLALSGAMPGWADAIPLMSIGDRMRLWIPHELANKNQPGKPQGMLVFEIDLLEIKVVNVEAPAQPGAQPAPPDVAAPPKDVKKSPKGVFYKILTAKKGTAHPKKTDTLKVNYTGWTTDGKMFDTSLTTGRPAITELDGMIAGWIDAVPLMGVGEKARFWIPEALAYEGAEGSPKGMLVFDIELVEIVPTQP